MIIEENLDFDSFVNLNDKGSDCIVFQPGSHSVKFGYASQSIPFLIPNCVAYKKYQLDNNNNGMDIDLERKDNDQVDEAFSNNILNIEQEIIKKMIKLEQKNKIKKSQIPNQKPKVII